MAETLSVSIYGMFDCHLFHQYQGSTVDEIIDNWLEHISKPISAELDDGRLVKDLGATDLCPAIVMNGETEVRRVGPMVHVGSDRKPNLKLLEEYRKALSADPDIPRLLKLQ